MGLTEEQIGVKMRLQGTSEYQAQMKKSTDVTLAYGDAAERAGAQAKSGAVGIDAMAASSKKGVGSLERMKKAGEGLKSTGSKLTGAFTVPIALIGGVGVKMALDFSDAMEQISTQAGASQREVGIMTKKVMEFAASGKSSEGPNQLAEGLYSIESAGFRGKRAFEALVRSEQLATVGHADFGKTSKAVAAAMATQIKGTQNLGETVGLMNSIVGIGSMRMEDLLSAMGTGLLDKSAGLGLSLQEVGAALGVLTTTGTPAAASSTRMAMAFNMMAAPTEKAAKAMESIGLSESQLAMSMRQRGLVPTIELLKSKLDETFGTNKQGLVEQSKAISEMFGGGRTSGGIISLMRHIDMLKSKTGELTGSQEKFKHALEHTEEQPITKLHQAWAQAQTVLIELGNILIPVLTKVVKFFTGLFQAFSHLPPSVKQVIVFAMLAIGVLGPLLSLIGTMTIGIVALGDALMFLATNPVGAVITAVALAAIGFYTLYTQVEWFHKAVDDVVSFLKAHPLLLFGISPFLAEVVLIIQHFDWIKNAVHNVIHFFELLPQRALAGVQALPGLIKTLVIKSIVFMALLPIKVPIFFVQMGIKIVGILIGLLPKLLSIGGKMAVFIGHGVAQGASAIWGWVKTLPGKFMSAVASIASQLASVGANIAKEIANGLKNELLSILPGPVKDALEGATGVAGEVGGFLGGVFASGTTFAPGGISLVGEQGPELVNLPRGSEVINASRTRRVMDSPEATVRPLRYRGGPTPTRLENGRVRGAGVAKRPPIRQPIKVEMKVSRRTFGEAMVMALIDDEENE
jgi:TP901 family phage tail tape measure protein